MSNVLVCALVFTSLAAVDSGQQRRASRATATLAVVVTDTAGAPVGEVLVTVDGPTKRSARTEGGRIAFENLAPGAYRLRFEREGFITLERELTARGGPPIDVKVTLAPVPPPPPPPPQPEAPEPPAPAVETDAKPVAFDLPDFIEKNYIGREPAKTTDMACAGSGTATLIQVKDQLEHHAHSGADEFLYVIAGDGSIQIAERSEPLHAGMFVMIPRGVAHSIAVSGRRPLVIMATRAGEGCGAR